MAEVQPQAHAAQTQAQQPQLTSPAPPPKKGKDPKRVAAGKAVAEKTRQAREAQKKELEDSKAQLARYKEEEAAAAAPATTVQEGPTGSKDKGGISWGTVVGVGGLIVGAAGVYYQREALQKRFQSFVSPKRDSSPPPVVAREPAPQKETGIPMPKKGIRKMD